MSKLKYSNFYEHWKVWLAALGVVVLFVFAYTSGSLTGKVVEQNCYEEEICDNATIEICPEPVCGEVCVDVVEEVCLDSVVGEDCEEVCSEEGNETICEDICVDVVEEVCENVTESLCEEVCEESNCTMSAAPCEVQVVCEDVVVEEPSGKEEIVDEIDSVQADEEVSDVVSDVAVSDKVIVASELTESELSSLRKITNVPGVIVDSEVRVSRLIVRFEMGDYWVEKSYDEDVSEDLIERDKIVFQRRVLDTVK